MYMYHVIMWLLCIGLLSIMCINCFCNSIVPIIVFLFSTTIIIAGR